MVNIKISAVIPTINRTSELIGAVESLLKQNRVPFEIIVMDQNNPSNEILDDYLKTKPQVKHLRNLEPGHARNYNKCLAAATGDVVLFLDDDIIAREDLIENLTNIYQEDKSRRIAGVAGRVLNAKGDLDVSKIKTVGFFNGWIGRVTGNFNFNQSREVEFAQGAQMSFRREKILGAGGFDESFTGNAFFFETDLCLRIVEKGYKILFSPHCEVQHLMAPRGGGRINDKALSTYYYIRNGMIMERRHGFFFQWPVFVLWKIGYIFLKSIYNRSPRILYLGLKAMVDGAFA